jgi:hypothetical protein
MKRLVIEDAIEAAAYLRRGLTESGHLPVAGLLLSWGCRLRDGSIQPQGSRGR